MSTDDRRRWDAKYAGRSVPAQLAPDEWLVENVLSLPPGRALDLACGIGHNAVWLARRGWTVDAVDISPAGLRLAAGLAGRNKTSVNWIAADLDAFTPAAGACDLVLVFRFLDRVRLPRLIESALAAGGLLIYETFTTAHLARPDSHLKNPAYALGPRELPRLFPGLKLVRYREEALDDRSVARFVGRAG
ncbi:MAG TPA: class I SAM-dependent methyltransferase [Planctomycetaceae bacterium]|nr:class I SAM-dependent methyltransferase [Planctomycetaceae bacterium]